MLLLRQSVKSAFSTLDVQGVACDSLGVKAIELKPGEAILSNGVVEIQAFSVPVVDPDTETIVTVDYLVGLSECPCDPRRRHERLGQKVAVV